MLFIDKDYYYMILIFRKFYSEKKLENKREMISILYTPKENRMINHFDVQESK